MRNTDVTAIEALMPQLQGADAGTVNRLAWQHGSLPVRLAMLGLAAARKAQSPLWWGYPPGVFIGYKWDGLAMRQRVAGLAGALRGRGYRVFLDAEQLDVSADACFSIPQFIASLHDCTFYVLLLTRASADSIAARQGKTTWLFDEVQHALRLTNSGRMFVVPVLLDAHGLIDGMFPLDRVIDLRDTPADADDWRRLHDVFAANPQQLSPARTTELADTVAQFDRLFLAQQWDASLSVLQRAASFSDSFDHGLRCMLHAMYTADQTRLASAVDRLHARYGAQLVRHLYTGYCTRHGIPNRRSPT